MTLSTNQTIFFKMMALSVATAIRTKNFCNTHWLKSDGSGWLHGGW